MIPLTFDQAVALARRIQTTPDGQLDRVMTGLSLRDIASLAILSHQLDEIAQAAALSVGNRDRDAWKALQERLLAAGYLPLQNIPATKEQPDGAR